MAKINSIYARDTNAIEHCEMPLQYFGIFKVELFKTEFETEIGAGF